MNMAVFTFFGPYILCYFGKYMGIGIINDCMHSVKSQTIKVIFFQPIESVMNKKISDRATTIAIEIDRGSPWCLMTFGEKLRRVHMEVVAFRTKMVIDHIQQDHQPFVMSRIDKLLKFFWASIGTIRSIGKDAIIAPVSF